MMTLFRLAPRGIFVAALAVSASSLFAQPVRQWAQLYQGPDDSFFSNGLAVAIDSTGNVYSAGQSATPNGIVATVVKYDPNGYEVWTRPIAQDDQHIAQVFVLRIAPDGGVIVGGSLAPNPPGPDSADYLITRLNGGTGLPDWATTVNGAGNGFDLLRDIAVDTTGNVYATGESFSGTDADILTVKLDPNGAELWRATKNGTAGGPDGINDTGSAIAVDPAGNVFITGGIQTGYIAATHVSTFTPITIKYTAAGVEAWSSLMSAPGVGATINLIADADASFGVIVSANSGTNQTTRFDSAGNPLWSTPFSSPGPDGIARATAFAATLLATGNIAITGTTCNSFRFAAGGLWMLDTGTGDLTRSQVFYDPDPESLHSGLRSISSDASGVLYAGGFTVFLSNDTLLQRGLVIAYDPATATELWSDSSSPSDTALTNVAAIAINSAGPNSGGLVVVGSQGTSPSSNAILTLQYAGQNSVSCAADFNADGTLNADDLADFVTGYFNDPADPRCDFNADTVVNSDDLGDFITAYFNGCQ